MFLADAGYCSEDNLTLPGPDRLIATGKHRDLEKQARAGGPAGNPRNEATAAMAARLATEEGITAYRQRGHIAETPTATSSTTCGSASSPCAVNPKQPPNGPSPPPESPRDCWRLRIHGGWSHASTEEVSR